MRFLVLKWVGRDPFRHNVRNILELHGKSTEYSRIILDALVYLLCSKLCEHNPPKPIPRAIDCEERNALRTTQPDLLSTLQSGTAQMWARLLTNLNVIFIRRIKSILSIKHRAGAEAPEAVRSASFPASVRSKTDILPRASSISISCEDLRLSAAFWLSRPILRPTAVSSRRIQNRWASQ